MRNLRLICCAALVLAACGAKSEQELRSAAPTTDSASTSTSTTIVEPVPSVPPPPDKEPEFDGQVREYSVDAFWFRGKTTKLCRNFGESIPPFCATPLLVDSESASDFDNVYQKLAKPITIRDAIGGDTEYSSLSLSLRLNGSLSYDPVTGTPVFSGKVLAAASASDSKAGESLLGTGTLVSTPDKDISDDLLALGQEITPTGSIQIFGSPNGFLIWSFPFCQAGLRQLV